MSRSRSRSPRSRSRGRSEDRQETSKKIYISNLSPDTNEEELRTKFEQYGRIEKVDIKKKGDDITFAFIEYGSTKEAEKALAMHRREFQNRTLKVEFAKGGKGFDSRGGFRGGRGGYDRDRGGSSYRGSRPEGGRFMDRGDRPPRSDAKCFNCQGTGHFIKDCPKPRDNSFRGGSSRGYDRGDRGDRGDRDRDRDRPRRRSSSGSSGGGDRRRRDTSRTDY